MPSSWLLIEHGTVIDGDANPALDNTAVLVKDNRIHAVGPGADRSAVPTGAELTTIDATGKTVMPGLIDAHCHMTYGEARTQEEEDLYTSHELRTLIAAWNLKKVLRAGVTSISQPGGSYFIGVGLREGMKAGLIEGPRMTAAGRYLSTSNSLTDWYPDSVGVPDGSIGILTNTVDEMKAEVRRQVKGGVDLIKLADSPYGEYQAFTGDEMKAVVDLTHQLRRKITIHARGSAEVDAAVAAGFDWIMHANVMTDDVIQRLAESQIPLVPTLLLLGNLAEFGPLCGAPAGQRDGAKRMLDKTAATYHKAKEAGVKFAMGTDTGFAVTPYGEWHARELQLLMDYAGLSPLEAIQAGTKNAAVSVNLAGQVGEIATGKLADVIVVDGNPLQDMSVLWRKGSVSHVIKDGKPVRFDDELDFERHPHQRALIYSLSDLTQDVVYGEVETEGSEPRPSFAWSPTFAREMAHEINTHELAEWTIADA
jgi:imidazolonepropionase-like amidohydrolase